METPVYAETAKKLTHEYVQEQSLPFVAWKWDWDPNAKNPVKVIVTKYDLLDGASRKTIEWHPADDTRKKTRSSVDHLYQDEQSVLDEMALAKVYVAEHPEYDELLVQRNRLYDALFHLTRSGFGDATREEAIAALRSCGLTHREDPTGLLK